MRKKTTLINVLLILALVLLLGWGGYTWLNPKLPSSVGAEAVSAVQRELKVPILSRQSYSYALAQDVTELNLFRKQRRKFYRPKPPKPKPQVKRALPKVALAPPPPPPRPTAPPPQLVLTGVLLLGDQRVAIFEGTYSEFRSGRLVQNLKPKRRGYKVGESIGAYTIQNIDTSYATLSAAADNQLTLTLSKTPPGKKIRRTGNQLTQKGKTISKNFKRLSPPRRTHRSQPIPVQKDPGIRETPPVTAPPAVSIPGSNRPIPEPFTPEYLEQIRKKALGF